MGIDSSQNKIVLEVEARTKKASAKLKKLMKTISAIGKVTMQGMRQGAAPDINKAQKAQEKYWKNYMSNVRGAKRIRPPPLAKAIPAPTPKPTWFEDRGIKDVAKAQTAQSNYWKDYMSNVRGATRLKTIVPSALEFKHTKLSDAFGSRDESDVAKKQKSDEAYWKNYMSTVQGATNVNQNAATEVENLRKGFDGFGQTLRMPFEQWKKVNAEGEKFQTAGGKIANRVRMVTHGMRGFRMALLGVMFAGQNLNKSMMKMLQPAMQARGITEKWQRGLKDIFLPVIKAIEPAIKAITKWMKELSPAAKMVIGGFVVFTAVVGKLLFLIGSFGLAIGSLIMLLPNSRNKLVEVTATMTAYTAATVAATIATGAFTIATGGMSSVLGSFGGVTTGLIKPLKLLEKGFKGSGLHAAVKATTPEVKKFTNQFSKTAKLLKSSQKIVKGTEKAFKGSGLHAAVKATRFEVKDFVVGLLTMDFVLGNSGKKIPWYTKLWKGIVDVFNLAIDALRTWLGLDTPDTPEPPKPDIAGPGDTVMTPTGGVSTAFPDQYRPDIPSTDYWDPGVITEGNKIIAESIGKTQMAKTGGLEGSTEQGTIVLNAPKVIFPSSGSSFPDILPKIPESPIPTAPSFSSLFEQLAARLGVNAGSEYSRATEQAEAGQTIVQVYVDGSEVTSRFNEKIIDSTKNMGAF